MINLAEILKLKFPTINLVNEVIIQNDGQGAYIKKWNLKDTTMPTQEDIDKWAIEFDLDFRRQQVQNIREAEYPKLKELIIALWESQVENRPAALQAIQTRREAVKLKYPLPE